MNLTNRKVFTLINSTIIQGEKLNIEILSLHIILILLGINIAIRTDESHIR